MTERVPEVKTAKDPKIIAEFFGSFATKNENIGVLL